jgi:hypothetical protein
VIHTKRIDGTKYLFFYLPVYKNMGRNPRPSGTVSRFGLMGLMGLAPDPKDVVKREQLKAAIEVPPQFLK